MIFKISQVKSFKNNYIINGTLIPNENEVDVFKEIVSCSNELLNEEMKERIHPDMENMTISYENVLCSKLKKGLKLYKMILGLDVEFDRSKAVYVPILSDEEEYIFELELEVM